MAFHGVLPRAFYVPPHLRARDRQDSLHSGNEKTVTLVVTPSEKLSSEGKEKAFIGESDDGMFSQSKPILAEDSDSDEDTEDESKPAIAKRKAINGNDIQHLHSIPTITVSFPNVQKMPAETALPLRSGSVAKIAGNSGDGEVTTASWKHCSSDSEKDGIEQNAGDYDKDYANLEDIVSRYLFFTPGPSDGEEWDKALRSFCEKYGEIPRKVAEDLVAQSCRKHLHKDEQGRTKSPDRSGPATKFSISEPGKTDVHTQNCSDIESISEQSFKAELAAPTPLASFEVQRFLVQQGSTSQLEDSYNLSAPKFNTPITCSVESSEADAANGEEKDVTDEVTTSTKSVKIGRGHAEDESNDAGDKISPSSQNTTSVPEALSTDDTMASRGLPRNTRGGSFTPRRTSAKASAKTAGTAHQWNAPRPTAVNRQGFVPVRITGDAEHRNESGRLTPPNVGMIKEKTAPVMRHAKYLVPPSSTQSPDAAEAVIPFSTVRPQVFVYDGGKWDHENANDEQKEIFKRVDKWRHEVEKIPPLIVSHESLLSTFESDIVPRNWIRTQVGGVPFRLYYFSRDTALPEVDIGDFDPVPYWERFKGQNSSLLIPLQVPNCQLDHRDVFYHMAKNSLTSEEHFEEFQKQEAIKEKELKIAEQIYWYGMRLTTPDSNKPPETYIESDTNGWGPEPSEVGRHKAFCRGQIYKPKPKGHEVKKEVQSPEFGHPLRSQPVNLEELGLTRANKAGFNCLSSGNGLDASKVRPESSETMEQKHEEEARARRVLTSRRRSYELRVCDIETDAVQIQKIYNRAIHLGPGVAETKELSLIEIVKRMGDATNETMPWVVAVVNYHHSNEFTIGAVIGFGQVVRRTKENDTLLSELGQLQVVVDVSWRNVGVGTALLQHMSNMVQPLYEFQSEVKFQGEQAACKLPFRMLMVDCFYFESDDPKDQFSRYSRLKRLMQRNGYRLAANMKSIAEKHNMGVNCAIFQLDCRPEAYLRSEGWRY